MNVIAAPGLKVPKEGKPREYITDAQAEEVPVTAYYLRRMADFELLEAPTATLKVADVQADPTSAAADAKTQSKKAV